MLKTHSFWCFLFPVLDLFLLVNLLIRGCTFMLLCVLDKCSGSLRLAENYSFYVCWTALGLHTGMQAQQKPKEEDTAIQEHRSSLCALTLCPAPPLFLHPFPILFTLDNNCWCFCFQCTVIVRDSHNKAKNTATVYTPFLMSLIFFVHSGVHFATFVLGLKDFSIQTFLSADILLTNFESSTYLKVSFMLSDFETWFPLGNIPSGPVTFFPVNSAGDPIVFSLTPFVQRSEPHPPKSHLELLCAVSLTLLSLPVAIVNSLSLSLVLAT